MSTQGFNFLDLLGDANFQQLLAGVGSSLDPEGVGGALGKATIAYTRNKAAQSLAAKQLDESRSDRQELRDYHRTLIDKLGGITPAGQPGVNSLKPTRTGSLSLDVDSPDPARLVSDLGGFTPSGRAGVNSISRSPAGSYLVDLDVTDPSGSAVPAATNVAQSTPTVADEITGLVPSPSDRNRLSYTPRLASQTVAEVDDLLSPYTGSRRNL